MVSDDVVVGCYAPVYAYVGDFLVQLRTFAVPFLDFSSRVAGLETAGI